MPGPYMLLVLPAGCFLMGEYPGGDGGGASGWEHTGTFVTDEEGNADPICFEIEHVGDVFEFEFRSNEGVFVSKLIVYPLVAPDCDGDSSHDYACAVRPYDGYDSSSGSWEPGFPAAALRLNRYTDWCVRIFYVEVDGSSPLGVEIDAAVRHLGEDAIGTGICGRADPESVCTCDDPAPAECPDEERR